MADDNEVNVFVLTAFLRNWGVEFDVVTNGRQALEKVQQRPYDLVLMDLQMPELDGYAATRRSALPDERFARLPIFAVSASTRMGHQHDRRRRLHRLHRQALQPRSSSRRSPGTSPSPQRLLRPPAKAPARRGEARGHRPRTRWPAPAPGRASASKVPARMAEGDSQPCWS